jgi:uncharacterized protein
VKFKIDDISAELKKISFTEPAAEINRALSGSGGGEFRIEQSVMVDLSYYRAGTEVFFEGTLAAKTRSYCARCAEEFSGVLERPFRFVLAPRALEPGSEELTDQDDAGYGHYDGDEVELGPLIQEEMLLAMPTRALCREDCRGLCPRCGVNLNQVQCACSEPQGDPRLAVLRTLKIRRG